MDMPDRNASAPSPEELRALAQPGEKIELRLAERLQTSAEVRHGQLETLLQGREQQAEVRLRQAGVLRRAGARTTDWRELVGRARDALPSPSEAGFAPPGGDPMELAPTLPDEEGPEQVTQRAMALVQQLASLGGGFLPQATATWTRVERQIVNTLGLEHHARIVSAQLTGGGRAVQGGDFHTVSRSALGTSLPAAGALADEVRQRFAWGQRIVPLTSGRYTIALGPQILLSLLTPLLNRLSAPALLARTSPWLGRLGDVVLDERVTLQADPTLPDGPRRGSRDDEGTPTSLCPLIDAGKIAGFVVDRESAARLSLDARGTAYSQSFGDVPTARPSSLAIVPGDQDLGGMLRHAPRVLLLEGWIGAQPTNPLRGEIAGNAVGLYLWEDGEVVGRVKNAVVSLSVFDALGPSLGALGNRPQWVAGGMLQPAPGYLPYALVEGVGVAVRG